MTPREIIDQTLEHEGGYVNHKNDRGGATNFGITIGFLQRIKPGATIHDIKNMTRDEAVEIYYDSLFAPNRIEELPSIVQDVYFDMIVNHGRRRAGILLQRGIKRSGVAIVADGIVGKNTRAAAITANQKSPCALRANVIEARKDFYLAIVRNDPSQHVFLEGWKNRNNSFRFA